MSSFKVLAIFKPGFHMIVTVGDASSRQARGHIGDGCVKWEHFLNDVADVPDQTGTVRGRIERVEMRLKVWFPYDNNNDRFHMSPCGTPTSILSVSESTGCLKKKVLPFDWK